MSIPFENPLSFLHKSAVLGLIEAGGAALCITGALARVNPSSIARITKAALSPIKPCPRFLNFASESAKKYSIAAKNHRDMIGTLGAISMYTIKGHADHAEEKLSQKEQDEANSARDARLAALENTVKNQNEELSLVISKISGLKQENLSALHRIEELEIEIARLRKEKETKMDTVRRRLF